MNLGATLYRLALYDDAVTALRQGIPLRRRQNPVHLALLAMALEGKHERDQAKRALQRMRELVSQGAPHSVYDRCVLAEAETLVSR